MLLGFKTEINPNNQQRTAFAKHAGTARHAWNQGLHYTRLILDVNRLAKEAGRDNLRIKFPSAIDLHKWLVAQVKPDNPWYYESSKSAPQNALRTLRVAWDRAFKKISKPPKFKKKGQHDSFTLDGTIKVLGDKRIQVPKIGIIKTFERLPQGTVPKSVTISRHADRWFISFCIEVEPQATEKTNRVVGVDLGVKALATLSNGEVFEGPKAYRQYRDKLARMQYLARNKQRGSKRWKKAMMRIARLHRKIANIRKDTLHKLTTYLAKSFDVIGIEDLNVSGMMANHKLAAAVADMGFYEFRRQLEYKTKLYGSKAVVIGRWEPTSKTCHCCGWKNDALTLGDRIFHCQQCGNSEDRDKNASLNIERLCLESLGEKDVEREGPTPRNEASRFQFVSKR